MASTLRLHFVSMSNSTFDNVGDLLGRFRECNCHRRDGDIEIVRLDGGSLVEQLVRKGNKRPVVSHCRE